MSQKISSGITTQKFQTKILLLYNHSELWQVFQTIIPLGIVLYFCE